MPEIISVMLYDAFAVGVMAYVAVVFNKWWIVLFAALFIQKIAIRCYEEEEDDQD